MNNEIKIIKNRFLFIFEPYEWFYPGGAIGVIAETFDGAVDTILAGAVLRSKSGGYNSYKAYSRKQFFTSKNNASVNTEFKHKWVTTHKLITVRSGPAMILFDNWNYKRAGCKL